jgi:hypothetical protein
VGVAKEAVEMTVTAATHAVEKTIEAVTHRAPTEKVEKTEPPPPVKHTMGDSAKSAEPR